MTLFKSTGYALAEATEATARAVMSLSGKGDKHGADHIAVETMRSVLDRLMLDVQIHIGEGEKDNAPMLFTGERLGQKQGEVEPLDLVVDPLECTTNFAHGLPDSLSAILATPANVATHVPGTYMEQMLLPPGAAHLMSDQISFDSSVAANLDVISQATGIPVKDLTVVVQDRPRHASLISRLRECGAGISLITSGSISAAAEMILKPNGRINMLWGTFGAPEGLILAAMANLSGYGFMGRMAPHNELMKQRCHSMELMGKSLVASQWIGKSEVILFSGIHSSTWLPGVERHIIQNREVYTVRTLLWREGDIRLLTHIDGKLVDDSPYGT